MVYECDDCSAALPAGARACPRCGETFEEPVPADAVMPKRGFSAAGPLTVAASPPDKQRLAEAQRLLTGLAVAANERTGETRPDAPTHTVPLPRSGPYVWRPASSAFAPPGLARTAPVIPISGGSPGLRMAGRILILGGLAVSGFYYLAFEPMDAVSRNGIVIGLGDLALGVLLLYIGRKSASPLRWQKSWNRKFARPTAKGRAGQR